MAHRSLLMSPNVEEGLDGPCTTLGPGPARAVTASQADLAPPDTGSEAFISRGFFLDLCSPGGPVPWRWLLKLRALIRKDSVKDIA